MGGISSLVDKLPGMGNLPGNVKEQMQGNPQKHLVAIINSMTPHERAYPAVIKATRKKRIAAGSGTSVQEVNRLLKQFMQMQKMMKKMGKGKNAMRGLMQGMAGRIPGMPFRG
jgi:signal recognition particle subunit SRP54